jgi:hypothetical protein
LGTLFFLFIFRWLPSFCFSEMSISDSIKVVVVLGGPGSGKGTQCDQLVKKFSFVALSAGELMRKEREGGSELGQKIKACVSFGFPCLMIPLCTCSYSLLLVTLIPLAGI